jgi:hypothetical protein
MAKELDKADCLAVALLPVTIPLSVLLRAWVIVLLWGWFIEPMWHITTPTRGSAVGLSLLVSFLTYDSSTKKDDRSLWVGYVIIFIGPLLTAFAGWCVHRWLA